MSLRNPLITSPVTIVRSDVSILECVKIMQTQNIGALLVVSADETRKLIGIFTERDLLKKFDIIQKGEHWLKPVQTVMTQPVRTVTPERIDEAPRIMLRHRIRHLPIVAQEGGKEHIIAVISMRDLFETLVSEHGLAIGGTLLKRLLKKESRAKTRVAVLAGDGVLLTTLKESISGIKSIELKRLHWYDTDRPELFLEEISGYRAILIDLDGELAARWAPVLNLLNQNKAVGKIVVAYDPTLHTLREIEVLEKLDASTRMSVFAKPINIGTLLNRL